MPLPIGLQLHIDSLPYQPAIAIQFRKSYVMVNQWTFGENFRSSVYVNLLVSPSCHVVTLVYCLISSQRLFYHIFRVHLNTALMSCSLNSRSSKSSWTNGAGSGTCTHTEYPPQVFKTCMSAYSIIPTYLHSLFNVSSAKTH